MKKPENTPPSELVATIESPNAPTLDISKAALSGMDLEAAAPALAPPEELRDAATAITAVVWNNNKRVNGLYTTFNARNAYMAIAGMGWKRLAITFDSTAEAMNLLAAHCREKSCRIDFAEDGGLVKEMYVW